MNNNTPNFFDRQTITAIALIFAIFLGWMSYMHKKYPDRYQPKPANVAEGAANVPVPVDNKPAPAAMTADGPQPVKIEPAQIPRGEKMVDFKSDNLVFQITSKGMGVRHLQLRKYTTRANEIVEFSLVNPPLSFETRLLGASDSIDFDVQKISDDVFVGHAKVGGLEITKTMQVDSEKYALNVKVNVTGSDPKFVGLTTFLSDAIEPKQPTSFLNRSQFDRQEAFVDAEDTHRKHVYYNSELFDQSYPKGHVASLGSQYFTQAVVDHSSVLPEMKLRMDPASRTAVFQLQHSVINKNAPFDIQYTAFAGPKSLSLLQSVDDDLVPLIDFGFFSWIARYILVMLKGFYSLVGNWGIAIILLTICVRLLVMPFNIMSYRSMKSMQALQPQMTALRERYKNDQQKLNQEMMGLLRTNKVNPIGGCLPVLLQLPIFLALYQVLGHSIELYQAPFGLWIHDLSLKDPFYVLPVLMGLTMFMQQKITPNTLDPAQAKIIMFMPLVFSVFMLSLPSGLTLYIWVSALFAVVQQFYFMKSHSPRVGNK